MLPRDYETHECISCHKRGFIPHVRTTNGSVCSQECWVLYLEKLSSLQKLAGLSPASAVDRLVRANTRAEVEAILER